MVADAGPWVDGVRGGGEAEARFKILCCFVVWDLGCYVLLYTDDGM